MYSLILYLPDSLTCFKKTLSSGLELGSMVAWKTGRKMFSSIFPKCGTKFLALKMSLQGGIKDILSVQFSQRD